MRIGKSNAFVCDFCANVIVGEPDKLEQAEGVNHFCRTDNCMAQYIIDVAFVDMIRERVDMLVADEVKNITHDRVNVEVEKQVRQEIRIMDKITCPKCVKRYKERFVKYY